MTDKKLTPLQVARQWATEHPDAEGTVSVAYLAPKGRCGRLGLERKYSTFYVKGGGAAQTRHSYKVNPPAHNGTCAICGHVYLDLVLVDTMTTDTRAGQLLAERPTYARDGETYIHAEFGYIPGACPSCIQDHNLIIGSPAFDWHDLASNTWHVMAKHLLSMHNDNVIATLEACDE